MSDEATDPPANARRAPPKDLPAAMREIYRLRHELDRETSRTREVLRELTQVRMDRSAAGIAGDAVYGRRALADARKVRRDIRDAMLNLADTVEQHGFGAGAMKATTDAREDLALLGVDRPSGPTVAALRNFAQRWLTHPSLLSILAEDAPGRMEAQRMFNMLVSVAYSDSAYARIFEKSPEIREESAKSSG